MIILKPIYKNRKLLLASNKKLTSEIINILRRNKYPGTYVYDEYSDYDDLSSLVDEQLRTEAIEAVEDFNSDKITFLATDIVDELMSKGSDFVIELNNLSLHDRNTYEHSVNVAITATACGIGMGLSNEELNDLAASAMLHDCGKLHVPLEILNKNGKLTPEEEFIMHRHVQYGYDMLYNKVSIKPIVRAGVLCHHENWDGTGYQRGLQGENIPLYARILHVADVYDALVRERPYKHSLGQHESIEYIMGGGGTMFDFNCVVTFLKYITLYPVGADVRLSDGRIGRVVKNRQGYLERPVVVSEGKVLDLADDKDLLSVTIIEEITEDNEVTTET